MLSSTQLLYELLYKIIMDQSDKITNKWSGPVFVIFSSKHHIFRMIIKCRLKLPIDPTATVVWIQFM